MSKKGKYADIVDKLPREWGTEPDYQDKVNAVKRQILEPPSDMTTEVDRGELTSDTLEDLILEVTSLQKVINDAMIKSIGGKLHASRIAQVYKDLRMMKDAYNEQEKTTNILIEAYGQVLIDQYEAEGVRSVELDSGGSVRFQLEPHGSVIDKDANREWAKANGLENSLVLHWQTVNALTKEALLAGDDVPAGVKATTRAKIVYSKDRN